MHLGLEEGDGCLGAVQTLSFANATVSFFPSVNLGLPNSHPRSNWQGARVRAETVRAGAAAEVHSPLRMYIFGFLATVIPRSVSGVVQKCKSLNNKVHEMVSQDDCEASQPASVGRCSWWRQAPTRWATAPPRGETRCTCSWAPAWAPAPCGNGASCPRSAAAASLRQTATGQGWMSRGSRTQTQSILSLVYRQRATCIV